jgi:Na+/H+ antiporter NhaD/arsenite permease-like protein
MIMMLWCKSTVDKTLMRVEWGVIFFFIGFFMIVAGLEHTGIITFLAGKIIEIGGTNLFLLTALVLCGSALFSAIMITYRSLSLWFR